MDIDYHRKQLLLSILMSSVVALVHTQLYSTNFAKRLELRTLDTMYWLRGELPVDPSITLIAVDDASVGNFGWPVSYDTWAKIVELAFDHGAHSVGFAFSFSPDQSDAPTNPLGQAASQRGPVVFPSHYEVPSLAIRDKASGLKRARNVVSPPHELRSSTSGNAHLHLLSDFDGVLRRVPMQIFHDGAVNAFALELYLAGTVGDEPLSVIRTEQSLELTVGRSAKQNIDLGNEVGTLLNFKSRPAGTSALALMRNIEQVEQGHPSSIDLKTLFSEKLVVIGVTAHSIGKFSKTPLSKTTPNVLVQVNAMDNLLSRSFLHPIGSWAPTLFILLASVFMGVCVVTLRTLRAAVVFALFFPALFAFSFWLFKSQALYLECATVGCSMLCSLVFSGLYRHLIVEKQERMITAALERKVTPSVLTRLLRNPELLRLEGQERRGTVLVANVVGYVGLADQDGGRTGELLRTYLQCFTNVALDYGGTLQQGSGDTVLAVFGAPLDLQEHECAAALCAQAMHEKINALNQAREAQGSAILTLRISIATGEIHCGDFGINERANYTVVGPPVTLASTLSGLAKPNQTLLAKESYHALTSLFQFRIYTQLRLSGYDGPQKAYEILFEDVIPEGKRNLRQNTRLHLNRPFAVTIGQTSHSGEALNISASGMYVRTNAQVELGDRISISIAMPVGDKEIPLTIDGLVKHVRAGENPDDGFGLEFKNVMSQSREAIEYIMNILVGELADDTYRIERGANQTGETVYTLRQ